MVGQRGEAAQPVSRTQGSLQRENPATALVCIIATNQRYRQRAEDPPLEEALRLSEAYVLEHSLASSTHYLQSASLVSAGRSARDIYWCVRLRDGRDTEENDILLVVRMDGSVERLHCT